VRRFIRLLVPVLFLATVMSVMIGFRHLETLDAHEMRMIEEFRERWMQEAKGPGLERIQETMAGSWVVSTNARGYFGPDYHAHPMGDGSAGFAWKYKVKIAGTYEIHVNYAAEFDRASNAPYTVTYGGGQTRMIPIDQRTDGGRWIHIGDFEYQEGEEGSVVLSNNADGYVIADAIKIVEKGNPSNKLILDNRNPTQGYEPVQQPLTQPAQQAPAQQQSEQAPAQQQPGQAPGSETSQQP
jgi:hypothetical protein